MLKSNLFDLLCIEESLEIDNVRISAICFLRCAEKKRGSAVSADGVTDNCFQRVINVVARGANLDSQHQCFTPRVRANEICRTLQGRNRAGTPKTNDGSPLHVLAEAHVRNEAATNIWAYVPCARTDGQEIHLLHASPGRL